MYVQTLSQNYAIPNGISQLWMIPRAIRPHAATLHYSVTLTRCANHSLIVVRLKIAPNEFFYQFPQKKFRCLFFVDRSLFPQGCDFRGRAGAVRRPARVVGLSAGVAQSDRKSTRLNSSH